MAQVWETLVFNLLLNIFDYIKKSNKTTKACRLCVGVKFSYQWKSKLKNLTCHRIPKLKKSFLLSKNPVLKSCRKSFKKFSFKTKHCKRLRRFYQYARFTCGHKTWFIWLTVWVISPNINHTALRRKNEKPGNDELRFNSCFSRFHRNMGKQGLRNCLCNTWFWSRGLIAVVWIPL